MHTASTRLLINGSSNSFVVVIIVKSKRINRGATYGLETPCQHHFTEDEFSIQWLKSKPEKQVFLKYSSNKLFSAVFGCSKTVGVRSIVSYLCIVLDVKDLHMYCSL